MGIWVLCGTGLAGIVLSVGMYLAAGARSASESAVDRLATIAKIAVPVGLILLYLHATYDLAALSEEVVGIFADNVGSSECRYSSFFNWR